MSKDADTPGICAAPWKLNAWAVVIGLIGAVGALVFRGMIALFHNLFFLGTLSFEYDANLHTVESPWGVAVILVPVIGAAGVSFLVSNFAPEAKGHGVPEVIDAIYYHRGLIRPVVALVKSLASALSIGSGGSVGREGPIVQIGSSFGSTLGQMLGVPVWQRITMIAAGAGAGIAATFNTPIGGVLFAVEIMLHEVSARTLVPVAIATLTASYVGRWFFGSHPSFVIPALEQPSFLDTEPVTLLMYVGLGVLMGLVSIAYIRAIYSCEVFFDTRIQGSYYKRHMLGMLPVGVIMFALMHFAGHYYVQGVGYATVQDVLQGEARWFLLLLAGLKLLVTALTLGSGASGGVFSPALFMGATLGASYGLAMQKISPALDVSPAAFALAGMAGVVGGSTGAAMTAIVMIFEMTLDYSTIIPVAICVIVCHAVRGQLHPTTIYTEKLVRRGHPVPQALQANCFELKSARDVMSRQFALIEGAESSHEWRALLDGQPHLQYFLLTGNHGVAGFVTRAALLEACEKPTADLVAIAERQFVPVGDGEVLSAVISRLQAVSARLAVVRSGDGPLTASGVLGVIGPDEIAAAAIDAGALF